MWAALAGIFIIGGECVSDVSHRSLAQAVYSAELGKVSARSCVNRHSVSQHRNTIIENIAYLGQVTASTCRRVNE
jgi:hypothetical protein